MGLDIKFVCMAKGVDRNAGKEVFHMLSKEPFTLDKGTKLMKYLQVLRDEAHNFAITTYRKKHLQSLKVSKLDDIVNIGQKRKMLLLKYFGSFESIKEASIDQIAKISGIGKKTAQNIFQSLHPEDH
jgi:excinuclease ABC subunit C